METEYISKQKADYSKTWNSSTQPVCLYFRSTTDNIYTAQDTHTESPNASTE